MTTEEFQEQLLKEMKGIRELLETQNELLEEINSNTRYPDINIGWDTEGPNGAPTPRQIGRELVRTLYIVNKMKIPDGA